MNNFLLLSVLLPVVGGLFSVILSRRATSGANWFGLLGSASGSLLGIVAGIQVLRSSSELNFALPWELPTGALEFTLDGLAAYFMVLIFFVTLVSSVFGYAYLKSHPEKARITGKTWFFTGVLLSSMVGVVLAADAFGFLFAWEMMSISSYFLVTTYHEKQEVREAGKTYLIAMHLGTLFLFVMFFLIDHYVGSLSFSAYGALATLPEGVVNTILVCAIIGFGTKAGFVPFHIWLPSAHPAAPSHVSAIMSGVMIKTAIYGLIRLILFLGPAAYSVAIPLVVIGAVSGLYGVLMALTQHDLKKLLAYHSIENIGIITIGIGLFLIGQAYGSPVVAYLGLAGALLHVMNHAIFKSLLFLGAGAILKQTGSKMLDDLGGLVKQMPKVTLMFFIGSASICALPPFNGFISEFLIYMSAFNGTAHLEFPQTLIILLAITSLALMGGLALACFAKVCGIVFLGSPRKPAEIKDVVEPTSGFLIPMAVFTVGCCLIGLFGSMAFAFVGKAVLGTKLLAGAYNASVFQEYSSVLNSITAISAVLIILVLVLVVIRRALLGRHGTETAGTWGCGYDKATPRIQYTSSSFAFPLILSFKAILRPKTTLSLKGHLFPSSGKFTTEIKDAFFHKFYVPIFRRALDSLSHLMWIQNGKVRLYSLYIIGTLVLLLTWGLRG